MEYKKYYGVLAGIVWSWGLLAADCSVIRGGTRVESFVQRTNCALQAVSSGDPGRAYMLMAPVYRYASVVIPHETDTSRQETRNAVEQIVRADVRDGAVADRLIKTYGTNQLYAALACARRVHPKTGQSIAPADVPKIIKELKLPTQLVADVNALLKPKLPERVAPRSTTKSAPAKTASAKKPASSTSAPVKKVPERTTSPALEISEPVGEVVSAKPSAEPTYEQLYLELQKLGADFQPLYKDAQAAKLRGDVSKAYDLSKKAYDNAQEQARLRDGILLRAEPSMREGLREMEALVSTRLAGAELLWLDCNALLKELEK